MIFVIAEPCPLGCYRVVLVKRVTDNHVFAWCSSCGIAWADPAKETWQLGDMGQAELHACLVADGSVIEYATPEDIKRAGLKDLVIAESAADSYSCKSIEQFNATYGCDTKLIEKARKTSEELRRERA